MSDDFVDTNIVLYTLSNDAIEISFDLKEIVWILHFSKIFTTIIRRNLPRTFQ
jgi:predicted nucleic acid-binding protein